MASLDGLSESTTVIVTAGEWTDGTPAPTARKEIANSGAVIDGQFYLFGGVSAGNVLRTLERYDPATDAWTTLAEAPLALWRSPVAASGGRLYVLGGYQSTSAFPFDPTNRAFEYDPATDTWREVATMPSARGASAAVALDGLIHVLGGAAGGPSAAHEVYDPATDAWSAAPELPNPRSGLTAAVVDRKIHHRIPAMMNGTRMAMVNVSDPGILARVASTRSVDWTTAALSSRQKPSDAQATSWTATKLSSNVAELDMVFT